MNREKITPPLLLLNLFKWFCKPEYHEDIEGDLLELFAKRSRHRGYSYAQWRMLKEILLLFRPGIIRPLIKTSQPLIYTSMFRHHLIISYRGFLKNKSSFLINLFGLSTGLACVLLIYLWVNDEWKMDRFHETNDQLYQVMQNYEYSGEIATWEYTPAYLGVELQKEMPEIAYTAATNTIYWHNGVEGILSYDDLQIQTEGLFASKDFFHVFSFELIEGDRDYVLGDKKNIVLTESLAQKLFHTTDQLVGKTLMWEHEKFEGPFVISGIVKDPPVHSTIQFEVLFNYEIALDNAIESREWYTDAACTYLILKEGTDIELFNQKIADFLPRKAGNDMRDNCSLFVQAFSDKYLHGYYEQGIAVGGRITYVNLFTIVALFILLIACINFMNLSTARATKKMKEIGVKKAIGASRNALISQFLAESTLISFLSLGIAILLITLFLPQFNHITAKYLSLHLASQEIWIILGIVLFTGLLAGSYPAFYLSNFHPVAVLKGRLPTSMGEQWIRKGLVIFQFSLSVIFMVGVWVIHQQIQFAQHKHLGFEKEHIINFESKGKTEHGLEPFLSELKHVAGVIEVTNMHGGNFLENRNHGIPPSWPGQAAELQNISFPRPHVGYGYVETLGLELIDGRSFSRGYVDERNKVIINQAAADLMGYEQPVGKTLYRGTYELAIIGVVNNYHHQSLREPIKPTFIRFLPDGKNVMVRLQKGIDKATIAQIATLYERYHPGYPFEFTYMDDDYDKLYVTERRVATLSQYFAMMAIIISCLGLLGLAIYTTEMRSKEIGIRKILGASVWKVVLLLSKDTISMVLAAIFIAIPISYVIARYWLNQFAFSIELQGIYFFGAAVLILWIAWSTVAIQTFKAAHLNPVECLRDE